MMPNAIHKQRILGQLFGPLKKRYGTAAPVNLPVLEQFLYGVCREGTTRDQADRAFRALQERFFDWNEIRVSSPREVAEVLAPLPDAEVRAERLIGLLQEVFETTFSFELEILHKKGLKQAAKHLSRYQAATPYAVAWAVQHALGGHAIPLDPPTLRVLRRLGLIDSEEDSETVRASLEHLIPKIRGPLFSDVISALADELCLEDKPNCRACPMANDCPTGRATVSAPGRPARSRANRVG